MMRVVLKDDDLPTITKNNMSSSGTSPHPVFHSPLVFRSPLVGRRRAAHQEKRGDDARSGTRQVEHALGDHEANVEEEVGCGEEGYEEDGGGDEEDRVEICNVIVHPETLVPTSKIDAAPEKFSSSNAIF